jgi:transcriptional regulator with XRE-family HTH domain
MLEHIRSVLSRNLVYYRGLKGLKQSELATSAGLNVQSYTQWENGQSWPGPDKLETLAIFHGIPSSALFSDPDNKMSLKVAADLLAAHFS